MTPENRIPELDAARGFCILGMAAVHLIFDLTELYPVLSWEYPRFFLLLKDQGGIAFFLISGISATLGRRHLRRSLIVFICAALVSAVTALAGFMPIRFGVLHCLAACMLCWEFFKNASARMCCIFGIALAAFGSLFETATVSAPYLYPLGLTAPGFESADFFPMFPYFGYFLLGAAFGKRYYTSRQSLFPNFSNHPFLCLCGRHSLLIYLIHQPVLIFAIEAALA